MKEVVGMKCPLCQRRVYEVIDTKLDGFDFGNSFNDLFNITNKKDGKKTLRCESGHEFKINV